MVVDEAFDVASLVKVRAELEALEFTHKETDLYRLSQSPDLSNLTDGEAAKLPELKTMCDFLYGEKVRSLVSSVTGCGALSDRVDLAGAVYRSGSHLLVHDDVIGSRKISFIIYLTRAEDKWTAEDGGCLELYATEDSSSSAASTATKLPREAPSARVVPSFNRLAFFTVEAGRSFHAVQEVAALEKDRISLQGWYHAADGSRADAGVSVRELRRQAAVTGWAPTSTAIPRPAMVRQKKQTLEKPKISEADLEELKTLGVHPMYLDDENLIVLAHAMKRQGVVRLANFLLPPLVGPVEAAIREADVRDSLGLGNGVPSDSAGITDTWRVVGPSHVRRYLELDCDAAMRKHEERRGAKAHRAEGGDDAPMAPPPMEVMLAMARDNLVRAPAFERFIAAIVSTSVSGAFNSRRDAVRRFRPGLDYTLATMPSEGTEVDVRLTFCTKPDADDDEGDGEAKKEESQLAADDNDDDAAEEEEDEDENDGDLWESLEVGGFDSYIQAVEGDSAVVADDEDTVTNLPCQSNCLTIAVRATDQMQFVKFVQSVAPSSRYDIDVTYRVSDE